MHRQIPAERELLVSFLSDLSYWCYPPTINFTVFSAPTLLPGTIALLLRIAKSESCSLDKLKRIASAYMLNTHSAEHVASEKISSFCEVVLQAASLNELNNHVTFIKNHRAIAY